MEENFTQQDLEFIQSRGISLQKIEQQLRFFKEGIAKINLVKSATVNDGIWIFSTDEKERFCRYFDRHKNKYSIIKFVPASGAASRMFKFLSEFLNEFNPETDTINAYINRKKANDLSIFLIGLKEFPFYESLKLRAIELYPNFLEKEKDERNYLLIKLLLDKSEFNFANKPKGVLPFHKKNNAVVTPVEEHLIESEYYKTENKKTAIHFTVSREHQSLFENITNNYPEYDITFSYQHSSTDTIAVNLDNTPFRDEKQNVVFRPGGHGALIENLNNLNADVVFIKNIDNVSHNHFNEILENKKLLGGVLLYTQYQVFNYLTVLESNNFSKVSLPEIIQFVQNNLQIQLNEDFEQYQREYQIASLTKILNKPIRVCGMVRNEGEPGGGPFFVKDEKGKISLQIVETSQIDLKNEKQKNIVENATHFNPVDLVCAIKDYKNQKFNLLDYIDENAGFIVEKNKNGMPLKGYELPGLWNGAMAKWITVFVEVPLATFNPVKTVNDLLKPAHQPTYE